MSEENVQEDKNIEVDKDTPKGRKKKLVIILSIAAVIFIVVIIYLFKRINEFDWLSNQMVAIYIAIGMIAASVSAWFMFRKTIRTRLRMEKVIRDDPDINDWLVIFNWTTKILYVPTIAASFLAAILISIGCNQTVIGGIWFAVFFLNFLIEEYNISIKILLITLISLGFFLLWLHLLGKVTDFLGLFKKIAISMNFTVYFLVGLIGLLAIFTSWLKGLFYYISITPNYMNLQDGPTESGEQIGREDYNTRIDTSDFLERLMGFGRIIITFKDRKREPIIILVWRIQKKAQLLERVRAKFAIDHMQGTGA